VLGFDCRDEYSAIRTRYIFSVVSIEEEEEDFFMLSSRVLKEAPFQSDKCTLPFKRKNMSIFYIFPNSNRNCVRK
jgi:hypothetical protein